jgi:hypothetical protein
MLFFHYCSTTKISWIICTLKYEDNRKSVFEFLHNNKDLSITIKKKHMESAKIKKVRKVLNRNDKTKKMTVFCQKNSIILPKKTK